MFLIKQVLNWTCFFFTLIFKNMKKQTAVEWLVNQLEEHYVKIDIKNTVVFQQAKAMEKEQMKDAVLDDVLTENMKKKFAERFEQYYNETYKKSLDA